MRGSKFPADMHINYIWCPIHIPSFMIIGSVVSEELRWQDFGTDGQTDGQSDCTPRPAFAFGAAGKNKYLECSQKINVHVYHENSNIHYLELWPMWVCIFFSKYVKCQGQQKDLITGNIHVKFQSSRTHCSKLLISKVKVVKKQVKLQGQNCWYPWKLRSCHKKHLCKIAKL